MPPSTSWNDFLHEHNQHHILQSEQWGVLKTSFGWESRVIIEGQWGGQLLIKKVFPGIRMAYIPKGPVAPENELRSWLSGDAGGNAAAFFACVDEFCKTNRIAFLKVEPDFPALGQHINGAPEGFVRSSHAIQPLNTILVDISPSEDTILRRMKQKTRYNIRLAERHGVLVEATDNMEEIYPLMVQTGKRDGFGVHQREYYEKAYSLFHPLGQCEYMTAKLDGKIIAAIMVFARGKRAWYFYGASSDENRQVMAPYLLQWRAIQWAKGMGCILYDLWGIPDCDEAELEENFMKKKDGLWGVYRFKRGFGGEIVRYEGSYDRVYQPVVYTLYRAWVKTWR